MTLSLSELTYELTEHEEQHFELTFSRPLDDSGEEDRASASVSVTRDALSGTIMTVWCRWADPPMDEARCSDIAERFVRVNGDDFWM